MYFFNGFIFKNERELRAYFDKFIVQWVTQDNEFYVWLEDEKEINTKAAKKLSKDVIKQLKKEMANDYFKAWINGEIEVEEDNFVVKAIYWDGREKA